jgi:hypothetical protein
MYLLLKNGTVAQYPYTVGQLKRDNPQTSFPTEMSVYSLAGFDVYPVQKTAIPTHDPSTHKVVEGVPKQINSEWRQSWTVVALSAEELQVSAQKVKDEIVQQTQDRLDTFARTRNYDGILSACTYATSSVPKFQAEGQYCVDARDNTWATLYTLLAEVEAGTRPIPTGYAEIEPLLPTLVWPA